MDEMRSNDAKRNEQRAEMLSAKLYKNVAP